MTNNRLLAVVCLLLLAACNVPRGAAFQREVLRASEDVEAPFAVEPVTEVSLDRLLAWPATGAARLGWLRRQQQPASSLIAAGDRIEITLWESSGDSLLTGLGQKQVRLQPVQVGPDGRVALPYVGELHLAGLGIERARATIEQAFAAAIPSAQVQILVAPGRSNSVDLVGGVGAPGAYPLPDRDFTLLGLLSLGGGVRPTLVNPQVRLMRGEKIYGTSIDRLYADPARDTTLVAGDRVIVTEDERRYLSLGATGLQSAHPFTRDTLSALEALAEIGGVNPNRADPKGVLILRQYPAAAVRPDGRGPGRQRVVFTIDLTSADGLFSAGKFPIFPGDLIYGTESPVTEVHTIFGILRGALTLSNQAGNLGN